MTTTIGPSNSIHTEVPKTQAQLIQELHQRTKRNFQFSVYASWVVLLAILLYVFSGLQLASGPQGTTLSIPKQDRVLISLPFGLPGEVKLTTVGLDWDFIATWAPFIFQGVGQTIE